MCGEDLDRIAPSVGPLGSPPRVWGRHAGATNAQFAARITPTCVGKTAVSPTCRPALPDHPHVCGEDCLRVVNHHGALGSPPRVWGRHTAVWDIYPAQRITPTCVGKTQARRLTVRRTGDHPHVCGEDTSLAAIAVPSPGSPPRVWGRHFI